MERPRSGQDHSMRSKEEAHDYRYFPEPDLVPRGDLRRMDRRGPEHLPELSSWQSGPRSSRSTACPLYDASVLTSSRALADYFEARGRGCARNPKAASNWIMGDCARAT